MVRLAKVLESLRSKDGDEYEFVCFVMVPVMS